jgi:signal transduction histidine kinase
MSSLVLILQYAVAIGFLLVTLVAYREWLVWRGPNRACLSIATALLATVSFLSIASAAAHGLLSYLLTDLTVACFLGAGFALFLFRHTLLAVRRRVLIAVTGLCVVALVFTVVVVTLPVTGILPQALDGAMVLVAWLGCVGEPVVRLWVFSKGRPAVQQARLRALSTAYAGIIVLTVIETLGYSLTTVPPIHLALEVLSLAIIPILYVSFAPPRWLRRLWRQPEEDAYSAAMRDLLLFSPDRAALATKATEWAVRLVGGDGGTMIGTDGRLLARSGVSEEEALALKTALLSSDRQVSRSPLDPTHSAILLPSRTDRGAGGLAVVAGAFTPIFGSDEISRLEQYVAATTAALERVSLVESLRHREEEVRLLNRDLERRVDQRTSQLRASNRELEAFSYTVSHDLRAPLRAVDGFARILLDEYEKYLPDEGKRYLRLIGTNAEDMGSLIDALLNFSRLSRAPMRRQEVDLVEVVRHAVALASTGLGDRRVEFKVNALPQVQSDPVLLQEVYANLIGNAVKFTRERDNAVIEMGVEVSAQRPDEQAFYVRDNGVGFDMRYADKIFGVFQRLHRGHEYEGTGAGLAIVQRIINRHGGRVWVDAVQGQGATFYFTLGGATEDD